MQALAAASTPAHAGEVQLAVKVVTLTNIISSSLHVGLVASTASYLLLLNGDDPLGRSLAS